MERLGIVLNRHNFVDDTLITLFDKTALRSIYLFFLFLSIFKMIASLH